jgi:hypothetical protein
MVGVDSMIKIRRDDCAVSNLVRLSIPVIMFVLVIMHESSE